jgi:hypothetical protein
VASLSLVFDILANDKASKKFRDVGESAEKTGRKVSDAGDKGGRKFGGGIAAGLGIAAGAFAAAGIGRLFTGFIKDAAEAAKIGRLTDAVIKSTGGVANVSADQIGDLANRLSNLSAVDDEVIQSSTNVLLTFTKVRNETGKGNDVFDQAAKAALNMSAALGTDLQGSTLQLGKALNDPIKGVTALSKAGVQFTQQQKDQIKAMVESGDVLGAQKIILAEMETQFAGAAEAAADPIERLKTAAGNLGEEVGTALLPTVERFSTFAIDTLIPAVQQFFDILFRGDFSGGPLGEEDSWLVDKLFDAREAFITVKDAIAQAFNILFRGDYTGGPLGEEDSWIVDKLFDARDAFFEFKDFVEREALPRIRDFFTFVRDDLVPMLGRLATMFREEIPTAINRFIESFRLGSTETKATHGSMKDFYDFTRNFVLPFIEITLRSSFILLQATLGQLGLALGVLKTGFGLWAEFVQAVTRTAVDLFLGGVEQIVTAAATAFGWVPGLGDKLRAAAEGVQRFRDDVNAALSGIRDKEIRVSLAADEAAGAAALARIARQAGDGPGRGGPALARVQRLIAGTGAYVTSTYRTPAQNRAVGGSPNSYHLDRNDPAVDIGGPTYVLDRVFRSLMASAGSWRELLWRVPGHFDHIHVAHAGGMVSSSWPTMPGLRHDERPAILQTGERVLSRRDVAGAGTTVNFSPTLLVRDRADADLVLRDFEWRLAAGGF